MLFRFWRVVPTVYHCVSMWLSLPSLMTPSGTPPPPATGPFRFTENARGFLTLLLAFSNWSMAIVRTTLYPPPSAPWTYAPRPSLDTPPAASVMTVGATVTVASSPVQITAPAAQSLDPLHVGNPLIPPPRSISAAD